MAGGVIIIFNPYVAEAERSLRVLFQHTNLLLELLRIDPEVVSFTDGQIFPSAAFHGFKNIVFSRCFAMQLNGLITFLKEKANLVRVLICISLTNFTGAI